MFIIELTYTAPLAEIDHHLEAHKSFLEKYYASENFIMSGRKDPRNGGIILAQAPSRGEIERVISEDPFHMHGLAEYTITKFIPSMTAKNLNLAALK